MTRTLISKIVEKGNINHEGTDKSTMIYISFDLLLLGDQLNVKGAVSITEIKYVARRQLFVDSPDWFGEK